MKAHIKRFLLWSQKYTRMDMLYLARGSFWVSFNQISSAVFSLVLLIALANLLPKETYGVYRYLLSVAGIMNIFTLTGMNSAVTQVVAKGNTGILKAATVYQLKWNLLMLAALLALGGYYMAQGNVNFAVACLVLGVFAPATLAFNTYGPYLQGRRQFKTVNIMSVVSTFIYTLGTIVAALLSKEYTWLIVVYAATTFVPSVYFYMHTLKRYANSTPDPEHVEEVIAYGKKLTYIKLLGPVASQIDKIIIGHLWGPAQLATYALATAIPNRITPSLKDIVDIGLPKFATRTASEINTVLFQRIFQGMAAGALVTLLYIWAAPYIFTYLLPQYLDGIWYSQLLSVSFIFALPTRYIGQLFLAHQRSRQLFITSMINSVLLIALFIICGLAYGLLGLVIAQVLHAFVSLMVVIAFWKAQK